MRKIYLHKRFDSFVLIVSDLSLISFLSVVEFGKKTDKE